MGTIRPCRRNAGSRARSSTPSPSSAPSRRRWRRTVRSRSWRSAAARRRAPRPPTRPSLEAALEHALPKVDVVIDHRGLPGEIASGAAERLRTMVAEAEPDLVVWQVGTHDAIARVDVDAFASALAEAVGWVRSHGIDVVLVDPIYTASMAADVDYNRIVEAVRSVATQQGVPLVRRYEALQYLSRRSDKGEGHMLGRQFRLNDLGLRCMAEHVALTIATSLMRTEAPKEPKAAPAQPPLTEPQRAPG
ncbi:SGNH/GDSL hydrolase family protein [Methylobacterium oryzae CBMB20]